MDFLIFWYFDIVQNGRSAAIFTTCKTYLALHFENYRRYCSTFAWNTFLGSFLVNTMHEYRGYLRNQYPHSQSAGPKHVSWPRDVTRLTTWTRRPRWLCGCRIYDHWRLKWFHVSFKHPITKLTIPRQSGMDTESCDILFCLKLFIFEGAKWLHTWWWFAPKTRHRSKN